MSIFISQINYKKHIINLPEDKRSNLIITGKNGSGKTQLLTSIKKQLILIENNYYLKNPKLSLEKLQLEEFNERLYLNLLNNNDFFNLNFEENLEKKVRLESSLDDVNKRKKKKYAGLIFSGLNNEIELRSRINKGFIVAFFDAKRSLSFQKPTGITGGFKNKYSINDNAGSQFVQYLVNLKADRAFAFEENNVKQVSSIDQWFDTLLLSFQDLFETNDLSLEFDRKNFNFYLLISGQKLDFHNLSDGFSSIIFIVSEIIMRMGNKRRLKEEGIVLIDEIENHLHVSLQKKILKFLTSFFPNIQFIISTHSPFILSSIENATVYDMEKMKTSVNLSRYSYESLIEDYFSVDLYSDLIKERLNDYKKLVKRIEDLNAREKENLDYLTNYLKNIPNHLAPELKSEFYKNEIERWNKE
ncbi:AAA family ATPase [Priestia megaterium]|uniref:AAA family ATPase n=1 Tax=Priestia megaterium TaxID=1404 RepID=UPI0015D4FD81|nr:ATP-binding protein [Priestia megaterium]